MKKSVLVVGLSVVLTACSAFSHNDGNQNFGAYEMGRSLPEFISDESIEFTARKNLTRIEGVHANNVRIALDSYRREVLVTGEVPSLAVKQNVEAMLRSMKDVAKVHNYLTVVNTPKSQSHTVQENYLRSKINARLLTNQGVRLSQYKVVVRDRTAYVLGYMTQTQQRHILEAVRQTAGMAEAVTLATLVDEQTLSQAQTDVFNQNATKTEMSEGVVFGGIDDGATAGVAPANPMGYGSTQSQANNPYVLPSITMPNASTTSPTNTAPVFAPNGTGNSSYVQLHHGTTNP